MDRSGHVIGLAGIGYFQAPAVDRLTPFMIQPGLELVEFVVNGRIRVEVDGREVELGCGALLWEIEGDYSISRTRRDFPYECLTVRFNVRERRRQVPCVNVVADHERSRSLAAELLRAYHDDGVDRGLLGEYAYTRLLWEATAGAGTPAPLLFRPGFLVPLLDEIDRNFHRELPTDEMAAIAGVSVPHLHALFRRHLDSTPHQYLLARRIREAKVLLAGGRDQVKSVADACGFRSVEVFCRAFRQHVGQSPSCYRNEHTVPYVPWS